MAKETASIDPHLIAAGFDPTAPPDQALAGLRALRGNPGVTDLMIAQALGAIVSAEAASMLLELEAGARGEPRREIRRALFKLRQRGIEVHQPSAPGGRAQAAIVGEINGLLSFADAAGARIAWLAKARGGGGLRRLWCLVSATEGLLGATLETVTRKEYRADRAMIEGRAGTPLVEADWRLVDFVICEAYRQTPEERRGRVGNFLAIRAELIPDAPPLEFDHPIYDELKSALATDPPAELMQEPEVGAYQLPAALVKPYADEATNLRQSVIVLSRPQQEERVITVIERALADLLTGATAYRLRRHLEDTAYFFAHNGKIKQAGWAAAAAARLREGAELRRVPFFQAFMRAQLGALLAEQEEKAAEEPRLIMTPAEMMRARQAAQARMRGRVR